MVKNYLNLIKFSHTIFALPFAFVGYFLGACLSNTHIDYFLMIKVILCMVFARNAAMAFNRWADREIDAKNPRTKIREIPAGVISANGALVFTLVNSLLFMTVTYFINDLCFYLSPVALIVILGYSYTKRFTSWCHFILGLSLSLAPLGAYLAVTARFDLIPILFSLTVLTWVAGFDIVYALQDESFDKQYNLKSIPSKLGYNNAKNLSRALHILSTVFLIEAVSNSVIVYRASKPAAILGVLMFILMLIYQHYIVEKHGTAKINLAFFTLNGVASVIFGLLFVTALLTG